MQNIHEGKALRAYLREKGRTQQEVADEIEISRNYLIALFKEEEMPKKYKELFEKKLGIDFTSVSNTSQNNITTRNSMENKPEGYTGEYALLKEIIESKEETIKALREQIEILKKQNQ